MNNETGIPNGRAGPHGRGKAGAICVPDGSAEARMREGAETLPLVMVSDLPEEALPHTEKFPFWVRTLIFAAGAGLSWAIVYAIVHRG